MSEVVPKMSPGVIQPAVDEMLVWLDLNRFKLHLKSSISTLPNSHDTSNQYKLKAKS